MIHSLLLLCCENMLMGFIIFFWVMGQALTDRSRITLMTPKVQTSDAGLVQDLHGRETMGETLALAVRV